jgi:nuclear pore complex protein Nup133
MFSSAQHEGGPAKGTRSSRRRQRTSETSTQQPKAKRQRVPLAETSSVNPDPQPDMYDVKPDKIDVHATKRDGIENAGAPRKELSVRSKKPKPGERVTKGDGSIVLVRPSVPRLDLECASS